MIPDGWKNEKLGDLFEFKNGVNTEAANYGSGIKFVNVMDVFSNSVLACEDIRGSVNLPENKTKLYLLKFGDVLFNRTSEVFNEIALCAVYLDSAPAVFGGFVIRGRPTTKKLDPRFCIYCFLSGNVRKELIRRGQGAIRANIGQADMKKVPLLLPPLPEQTKIANILTTWDTAIETVEKLIDNSRAQKKSLMQQLLRRRTRLPGFSKDWVSTQLKNIATIKTGTSKSQFIDGEGDNYILDMGSVNRVGKLTPTKRTKLSMDFLSAGDLVMPKDDIGGGNIIGRTGFVDRDNKYILGDHVYHLTINKAHSLFMHFLINSYDINKTLRRKANGTAQLGLGKKDVEKLFINIPPSTEEQAEIALLISNAEESIYLLHKHKQKLVTEKKALMQQLLTGKRRVNVE